MSIKVIYGCDGCDAKETVTLPHRTFQSITGKSYGIGSYTYPTVKDNAPQDWWAYDPWTGCCYCPTCREQIEKASE